MTSKNLLISKIKKTSWYKLQTFVSNNLSYQEFSSLNLPKGEFYQLQQVTAKDLAVIKIAKYLDFNKRDLFFDGIKKGDISLSFIFNKEKTFEFLEKEAKKDFVELPDWQFTTHVLVKKNFVDDECKCDLDNFQQDIIEILDIENLLIYLIENPELPNFFKTAEPGEDNYTTINRVFNS